MSASVAKRTGVRLVVEVEKIPLGNYIWHVVLRKVDTGRTRDPGAALTSGYGYPTAEAAQKAGRRALAEMTRP